MQWKELPRRVRILGLSLCDSEPPFLSLCASSSPIRKDNGFCLCLLHRAFMMNKTDSESRSLHDIMITRWT